MLTPTVRPSTRWDAASCRPRHRIRVARDQFQPHHRLTIILAVHTDANRAVWLGREQLHPRRRERPADRRRIAPGPGRRANSCRQRRGRCRAPRRHRRRSATQAASSLAARPYCRRLARRRRWARRLHRPRIPSRCRSRFIQGRQRRAARNTAARPIGTGWMRVASLVLRVSSTVASAGKR